MAHLTLTRTVPVRFPCRLKCSVCPREQDFLLEADVFVGALPTFSLAGTQVPPVLFHEFRYYSDEEHDNDTYDWSFDVPVTCSRQCRMRYESTEPG